MTKSDIFVFSFKYEGFPNVLPEVLVYGLPLVSTNCEWGSKEILDNIEYGMLVRVGDSDDLAEKMKIIAKNEELLSSERIS